MTIFGFGIEVLILNLIIAIPLFFLSRWIFRKWAINSTLNKWMPWVTTIVLTPIIYYSAIVLVMYSLFHYPDRDFEKESWAENPHERYEMTNDIISKDLLIELSKQEVRDLLGDDGFDNDEDHWSYYIGTVPGLHVDIDILNIYFIDDKVVSVHQTRS